MNCKSEKLSSLSKIQNIQIAGPDSQGHHIDCGPWADPIRANSSFFLPSHRLEKDILSSSESLNGRDCSELQNAETEVGQGTEMGEKPAAPTILVLRCAEFPT
jgi:hypothetical protein